MSKLHAFYLKTEQTEFPEVLLEEISKLIKQNQKLVRGEAVIKNDMIAVPFYRDRPNGFYVTTNKEAAMVNIKDKALFTAVKYHNNSENDFLYELALMVKYYLKENFIVNSDDFEHGISMDWISAAQKITEKGYPIEFVPSYNHSGANFIIDGKEVENTFDEDGGIFNSMFTLVTK